MKKLLFGLLASSTLLFISCQTESNDLLDETNLSVQDVLFTSEYPLVDFQGIKVHDRFGVVGKQKSGQKSMKESTQDLQSMLNNSYAVVQIVEMILPEFPRGKNERDALQMIQTDFPEFTTQALIDANIDIIDDYYALAMKARFIEVYLENFTIGPAGRTSDQGENVVIDDNDVYDDLDCLRDNSEWSLDTPVGSHYAVYVRYAVIKAQEAVQIAQSRYPNLVENNSRKDAYRQMVWVGLLSHYWLGHAIPFSEYFASSIAEAAEICKPNTEPSKQMDIHNNQVGLESYRSIAEQFPFFNRGHLKPLIVEAAEFEADLARYVDPAGLNDAQLITQITAVVPNYRAAFYDNSTIAPPPTCPDGYTINLLTGDCCRFDIINGEIVFYDCI